MTKDQFDSRYTVGRSFDGAWSVMDQQERKIEAGPWRDSQTAWDTLYFMRSHCEDNPPPPWAAETARLNAAGPAMLAACELAWEQGDLPVPVRAALAEAIRKATGQ